MFQINDLILYGTTGVCRVEAIETHDMPGVEKGKLYYRLAPLYQNGVVYVPAQSDKAPLRTIISREQAERLIDLLPAVSASDFDGRSPQELAAQYQQVLHLNDCESLAALVVSLYSKKQSALQSRKKFGRVDETYMKRARELLHGELAAALGIPYDEIEAYIAARIEGQRDGE